MPTTAALAALVARVVLASVLATTARAAVPVNTETMKNFGHSIKNGRLLAGTEIDLFRHTCATPPCTITQIHCPTAGPKGWDATIVRLYIDDDEPMNMTLLDLANIGNPTNMAPPTPPAPAVKPNLTEYYLGTAGKTCAQVCAAQSKTCSPHINVGYPIDKGEAMIQHLAKFNASIATCNRDTAAWFAADQPGFVCAPDPNKEHTNDCIGFAGIPPSVDCEGSFPATCRVCHCVDDKGGNGGNGGDGGTGDAQATPTPAPGGGDGGPWGVGLFGHTAKNGGVYSTVRIPFGSKFRATIESKMHGTFWFIVRGVESYPVVIGDVQLPAAARLKLHRFEAPTVGGELVTLANISKGTAGALLNVRFDAAGLFYGYLEACMRALIDQSTTPLFLSSGAEDYFLSAYYFNEGEFKTPNSGLTYFDGVGTLSAYKTHDRDPVFFNDGLALVFRNSETTVGCGDMDHCPNQFCVNNTQSTNPLVRSHTGNGDKYGRGARYGGEASEGAKKSTNAMYKTLIWTYEWPQGTEEQAQAQDQAPGAADERLLAFVIELGVGGHLTEAEEASIVQRLAGADAARLVAAASAYRTAMQADKALHPRAARMLKAILLG